jgi:prepilin-type N-terminal cleavage/methylation domain-containing protein
MPEPAGKYSVILRDSPFFTNCYRRACHVSLAQKPDEKAGFSSLRGIGGLLEVKNKKNQKGFTLIELALIIAVLGILGAVGAVKLTSMTAEADKAAARTTLANARSALAIALTKDTSDSNTAGTKDGKVSKAELGVYLQGFVAGTTTKQFTVEGITLHVDDDSDITQIGLEAF